MPLISQVVRTFVLERLADTIDGFGFWVADAAQDYVIDPFVLERGTNLFVGQLAADDIEASDSAVYPMATVWSQNTNQGRPPQTITPNLFAGPVVTVVDFWTSFAGTAVPDDAESYLDLVEDAMYETFNRQDYFSKTPPEVNYNNEMDSTRFPLGFGGENWRQQSRFVLTHRLYTMGRQ